MPDFDTREKRFEQDIEASLLTHGGYQKGNPAAFDRELSLIHISHQRFSVQCA